MMMSIMTINMATAIRMKRMVTNMGMKRTGMSTRTVRIMGMNKNMGMPTITDTIMTTARNMTTNSTAIPTTMAIPIATITNRVSKIPLTPPSSTSAACRTCAAS